MANIVVDCKGETCPMPLVQTRKAITQAAKGDTIEVIGDHPASVREIPMAVGLSENLRLLGVTESKGVWTITIKKTK